MSAPARNANKTVVCEGCGLRGDPTKITFFQMWTGWHRIHPKGSTMVGKRAEQRFACRPCVEAFAKSGSTWQQLSLLDG
jgi:hypothetical protein